MEIVLPGQGGGLMPKDSVEDANLDHTTLLARITDGRAEPS